MHNAQIPIAHIAYSESWDVIDISLDCRVLYDDMIVKWHDPATIFAPWQFMVLGTQINGEDIKRSYSIATTPLLFVQKKEIWFSIKRVDKWVFSTRITQQARPWMLVSIMWPFWHLVDTKKSWSYLLVSVWSGLSPIYSIYNSLVQSGNYDRIANIFWESYQNHIMPHVITERKEKKTETIVSDIYLSREQHPWFKTWYVQKWLRHALDFLHIQDMNSLSCFLCGKPEMVDDVRQRLAQAYVPSDRIFFEKY